MSLLGPQEKQLVLAEYWERFGPFRFVVETGIYNGQGSCYQFEDRAEVMAIEADPESAAAGRYGGHDVRTGDSRTLLPRLLASRDGPALFWLDAHSVSETDAPGDSPLLEELAAIIAWPHAAGSVVLVDDVRLMARDGWPSLVDVWNLCLRMTGRSGFWDWNDHDDILRLTPWEHAKIL